MKAIKYILIFCLSSLVVSVFFVKEIIEDKALKTATQFALDKFQIQLEIKSLNIDGIWPIQFKLNNIKIKKDFQDKNILKNEIEEIIFQANIIELLLNSKNKNLNANLFIKNLKMYSDIDKVSEFFSSRVTENTPTQKKEISSLSDVIPDNKIIKNFHLNIKIDNSELEIKKDVHVLKTNINFMNLELNTITKIVNFSSSTIYTINNPLIPFSIPLDIKAEAEFDKSTLRVKKGQLVLFGMINEFDFNFNLNNKYFDFKHKISIADLKTIPLPNIKDLPLKKMSGSIYAETNSRGYFSPNQIPYIQGRVDIIDFQPQIEFKNQEISLIGSPSINIKSEFEYNQLPKIKSANWKIDLSKLFILKKNVFQKAENILFKTEGSGSYLQKLSLEKFVVLFDRINFEAKGSISKTELSDIEFNVAPFEFANFQKFLIFLPQVSTSGTINANGTIKGFISKPEELELNLKNFKLLNVVFNYIYNQNGIITRGPININSSGSFLIKNKKAISGQIESKIDAKNLIIEKNNFALKNQNEPFLIDFKIMTENSKLQIKKCDVISAFADFNISGTPPLAFDDQFNFMVNLKKINWLVIKSFIPNNDFTSGIKGVNANGKIEISGKINPNDIPNSQIKIKSSTIANIDEIYLPISLKLDLKKNKDIKPVDTTTQKNPEPFIKNDSILKNIEISHVTFIKKINLNNEAQFENIKSLSNIKNLSLISQLEIEKIFDGKLSVNELIIPLTSPNPKITYKVKSDRINFEPIVKLFLPDFDKILKGFSSIEVQGSSLLPWSPDFIKNFQAKGNFKIQDGVFETFNFINVVKDQFSNIPQFSIPKSIDTGPLKIKSSAEFTIENEVIKTNPFEAITNEREELKLSGQVTLGLVADLKGTIGLTQLPVKGSFFDANKDSNGRVNIPIEIKGSLKKPDVSIGKDLISQMTQKTINFEKEKLIGKINTEVENQKKAMQKKAQDEVAKQKQQVEDQKKKVQAEIENKKKSLEDEAKKKLNDLFK